MKRLTLAVFTAMAVLAGGHSLLGASGIAAIISGQKDAPFLAAALSRFISDTRSFTSAGELSISRAGSDSISIPFGVAMDQGKLRMDVNPGTFVDPEMKTELANLNLDRLMLIYYPEHPLRLVLPSAKTYIELPLTNTTALQQEAGNQAARIQKTFVRDEAAAGLSAKMYRLSIPGGTNDQSAFVWEAPALNQMPVKLKVNSNGSTYTFLFRNVQQRALDPRVFGVPANFKKQGSMVDVIREAALANMKKSLESISGQLGAP
jgi:hypothetical protein